MNINPQDFISLPFFDWSFWLVIILAAFGVYGWGGAAIKITKKTAMYLSPAVVYLFFRDTFPSQEIREIVLLGVVLFYGTIVVWFFFIKKSKS